MLKEGDICILKTDRAIYVGPYLGEFRVLGRIYGVGYIPSSGYKFLGEPEDFKPFSEELLLYPDVVIISDRSDEPGKEVVPLVPSKK